MEKLGHSNTGMGMRIFYVLVFLVCVGFAAEAAVPQLQDFDTNQFGTAGGIVRIKSGANLTNPIVANGIAPTNANYLLFDFTNSLVPIAKVLVPGANVVFSPNATGIVLSVTAAGTNGFQDPGANGMVVRVATNTSVARQILGTTDQIAVDNGTGVGGDPTIRLIGPWTNNSGVVQLTTTTNSRLYVPLQYSSDDSNGGMYLYSTVVGTNTSSSGLASIYVGIEQASGTRPSNSVMSTGIWTENYVDATNTGPRLEDEIGAAFGITATSFGGGGFSSMPSATVIPGAGVGAQGFAASAYSFQAGTSGGVWGQNVFPQTNAGAFNYVGYVDTNNINVGTYGGLRQTTEMPTLVSAGGLFDGGKTTYAGSALVARKYDGTKALDVTWDGITSTRLGRIISRFATATNYTLTVANHYLVSTATQTNTLPAANAVAAGQIFIIKNKAGTTTVRPAGADTIDGVAADDVLASKASNTYISDGVSNWEKN